MTLLSMLDRFEQAAVTYETSTDKADRDELHAARRAIMEREAELVKALETAASTFEEIRLILIRKLDEPERRAFWKAVSGRVFCRAAIDPSLEQE